ncbi:TadE/TadG family type IV pilus assembly protein [Streptomyces sp. NPDC090022]|uniref:TadE/TadG family type IV pilus assembly protein n=1 Tax=Streptomyces sp. NPDC090022 TaxID=3365920 RepID=UPI0037F5726A
MIRPGRRAAGGDRGQVAVEFVGTVPLILLLVAAVWEGVLIGYAFSLAGNAADEAARAGAVKGDGACQAAAVEHVGDSWNPKALCGPVANGVYKATVDLTLPIIYPGMLDLDLTITGTAGSPMERETN